MRLQIPRDMTIKTGRVTFDNMNSGNNVELELKRSWAEIDLAQLCENYKIYKSRVPVGMSVMGVVKADAYGHGDVRCALALENVGAELFAVATIKEAVKLREGGVRGEILILGYTPVELWETLVKYDLTQTLLSEEYAKALADVASEKVKCQFAIDSGMNRIGLDAEAPAECERVIREYAEKFDLNGIYTHLCVADGDSGEDIGFTGRQRELFGGVACRVSDMGLKYVHCMNSAGGLFHSADGFVGNIARLGIVLYGLKPDRSNTLPEGIKGVMTWKTTVAMVKTVYENETVGYGRTFCAHKPTVVATLPTGYADGYNRLLSNKGYVLIKGKCANIIGRVCMDQMMVDVTEIDGVAMGDEVVLIGQSGDEIITADDMAALVGTIGYEIVCDVSARVDRVYVK